MSVPSTGAAVALICTPGGEDVWLHSEVTRALGSLPVSALQIFRDNMVRRIFFPGETILSEESDQKYLALREKPLPAITLFFVRLTASSCKPRIMGRFHKLRQTPICGCWMRIQGASGTWGRKHRDCRLFCAIGFRCRPVKVSRFCELVLDISRGFGALWVHWNWVICI